MDGIGETFDQRTHVSFSQAVSLSPPPNPMCLQLCSAFLLEAFVGWGQGEGVLEAQ